MMHNLLKDIIFCGIVHVTNAQIPSLVRNLVKLSGVLIGGVKWKFNFNHISLGSSTFAVLFMKTD